MNCLLAFEKNKKIKNFVFASSGAPIGNNLPPFNENSKTNPVSPYGVSKLSCEKYIDYFNKIKNLNCTALRFSNLYGPLSLRKTSLVSKVIKSIIKYRTITIYGDGKQTRDFLHVDDLCEAIIACSTSKKKLNSLYQLGSGKEKSVNQISDLIKKNYNFKIKKVYKKRLIGDVKEILQTQKNLKDFKWLPKKDLNQGLKEVTDWFNENY